MATKKTAAAKKTQTQSVVEGVVLERVKPSLVTKALLACDGFTKDKVEKMMLEERVVALQRFNQQNVAEDEIVVCDVDDGGCGGNFDDRLDACPFCGLVEPPEEGAAPKEKAAKEKPEKAEKSTALAVAKPAVTAVITAEEKRLDEVTGEILDLKMRQATGYFELGLKVAEVFKGDLWKMRTKGGKPVYTSFNQYCAQELKMPWSTCYTAMDVAAKFTRDQVEKFGGEKLVLVLRAPASVQPKLLQEVEKGIPRKELREKVKEEKQKAGLKKRETGRKQMPEGKPGWDRVNEKKNEGKPAKPAKMTVASVEGTKSLEMFAKPEKKLAEGEKPKPAKKLADKPFAMEELDNGVVRYYSVLVGAQGTLRLKIETKRAAKA